MDNVAEAIDAYLDEQRDVLTREPHTIYDGENVHDTRVAVRRFRTVLRVFADCFATAAVTGLDADLAWYAGLLGDVRDHQVLRDHLVGYLDTLPAEVDYDATARSVAAELAARERRARRALQRGLVTRRHERLLASVVAAGIDYDPQQDVADYLRAAERTARRRLRKAERLDPDDPQRDAALHRARKAVKRARYTAEVVTPVVGAAARRTAAKWRRTQDRLGVHQDEVVAAAFVRSLVDSDTDFALGVLWSRVAPH
jgi:CHAD domain-containing protein